MLATHDAFRTVRIRAGAALATFNTTRMDSQTETVVDRAVAEYADSLRSRPDDYAQRMNLGVLHADRGERNEALAEYGFAIRLRPGFAPPLVYNQLGRNREARGPRLRQPIRLQRQDRNGDG
jgi:cytochrome c-type biogenesis protein CcmH/NrfG